MVRVLFDAVQAYREDARAARMRIGYIYDFEAFPPRGGNHVHALELTRGFLQAGHAVSVIDDPTMPGTDNFSGTPADVERFMDGIDVLYVRIDARFTRHWNALASCMDLAVDCPVVWEINAPADEGQAYSWLGGKSANAPGDEGVIRRFRRWLHALRKIPGIALEERHRRRLARRVHHAVCVSSALGRYAREELGIDKVMVLPNGGPLITREEIDRRRGHRQHRGFSVLYTGSAIYPWQGLDYLARVIALAEHEAPDILFVLAVNQRTPGVPSSGNVTILEHLDREKILDAICSADACVSLHPEYHWAKYGFHNSPMKLFEYMACGRPVLTSNHGQMREIIRDGIDGLLCNNEPREILQKLLFLKNNPDKAERIGNKAWERVQEEYNWGRNVQETLKVFQGLVGSMSRKGHN